MNVKGYSLVVCVEITIAIEIWFVDLLLIVAKLEYLSFGYIIYKSFVLVIMPILRNDF